jgi:hypothetical protein
MKRLLRGPAASRMLAAAGIDPRRYWLLNDLFRALAERREIMSHLGRDGLTLKFASWLYLFLGGVLCLMFLSPAPTATRFLTVLSAFTAMVLACTLVSEAGNSLVNPTEALVLAHQPIDGATYTAAKLSHLLRVVACLAPALNLIPALASLLLLKQPFWYYPLIHLMATYLVGLLVALFACAIFGFLLRFVPPARLKSIGQIVESLPFVVMMFGGQLWRYVVPAMTRLFPDGSAIRHNAKFAFPAVAAVITVTGIRSLSVDYLARVSAIVHGGGQVKAKLRRSPVGDLVARWLGGPPARAGFAYTALLMRRDWAFRRQILPMIPVSISPLVALASGVRTDPFSGNFTAMHIVPHVFGIILFTICVAMTYGNDYKGAWVFLLTPSGAFDGFARGVHSLLWITVIGIPHLMLAVPLVWYWGIAHASVFLAYSLAVGSFYLALELRLIGGVPFSQQPVTSRGVYFMGIMILGGMCMALAVGLQYALLFRSVPVVLVVSTVLAGAAWAMTRASLGTFAVTMRYNLGLASAEVGSMFREVDG